MSLGHMKYSTGFTKSLQPFFRWCLSTFMASLDDETRRSLNSMIRSKKFRIIVTVHHRPHKLWEDYAKPYSPHPHRGGGAGRVYGLTRRYVGHRFRPDNIVHVDLPIQALCDGVRLARIFIHEFAHVCQNHLVWWGGEVGMIPKGGTWRNDAAEADAEQAEAQFGLAVAEKLGVLRSGLSADGIDVAINREIEAQWRRVIEKSPRLREIVEQARLMDRRYL